MSGLKNWSKNRSPRSLTGKKLPNKLVQNQNTNANHIGKTNKVMKIPNNSKAKKVVLTCLYTLLIN